MKLLIDTNSVEGRRRELRRLLIGRQITYPAMVLGMLGFDPNDLDVDDHVAVCADLEALGYAPRPRTRPYSSAYTMSWWHREADWPEDIGGAEPYRGMPLSPDPDLAIWDED